MTAMDVKQIDVQRLAAVLEGIEDMESKLRFLEQVLADLESWPLGDPAQFARNSMLQRGIPERNSPVT